MQEKLKSVYSALFSSYKKTAGVLFFAGLILTLPLVLSLVGQQQDIRQRASTQESVDCSTLFETYFSTYSVNPALLNEVKSQFSKYQCPVITPPETDATIQTADTTSTSCSLLKKYLDTLENRGTCSVCGSIKTIMSRYNCPGTSPLPSLTPSVTVSPSTSPSPSGIACAQVITYARNNATQECRQFPDACLPDGWTADQSCQQTTGGTTLIELSLILEGIGTNSAIFNTSPKKLSRRAEVKITDSDNRDLLTGDNVNYNPSTGIYKGTINLGTNFKSGQYLVKVRLDNTLWKQLPGIQTINSGFRNEVKSAVKLVSGDLNQDNYMDLTDYNLMLSCVRDKAGCIN